MNVQRIIAIGTSTGGAHALKQILSKLPADFPAAVLIVMHVGRYKSILPNILSATSNIQVRHAEDGARIEPGVALIAPPDHHLLVEGEHIRLSRGAKENFSRPAIDPLFRSAALHYRQNAIGIVLTGNLDDGTIGLQAIKSYGGTAIVQDPNEAEAPSMPLSALEYVEVDHCVPLASIAELLIELVRQPVKLRQSPIPDLELLSMENNCITEAEPTMEALDDCGMPSAFTCPDCHGVLWEIRKTKPQRFRCHTGHAFTASSLIEAQSESTEESLWGALRALHEKSAMLRRFAKSAAETQRLDDAAEYEAAAERASQQADTLRNIITSPELRSV